MATVIRKYFRPWTFVKHHDLKPAYDVVIIGGGVHGLGIAYELAKRGVKDIAVLDRHYIGYGGSGRNTTIIRANYRTPEGVAFYKESLRIFEQLSQELDINLMLSQMGHLSIAHNERSVNTQWERAGVNQSLGVDSRVIGREEIAKLCPDLDMSDRMPFPIMAALYHPPGGVLRHDALVWGYARQAVRRGVHIHQNTDVTGIGVSNGRVTGVRTNRGNISARQVVSCVAGWSSETARMVGLDLPITTHQLQAFVTEPVKPFLRVIIVSATLHVYISQTDRGEVLVGSEIEPYSNLSHTSTLNFLESCARHAVEMVPRIGTLKMMRTWAGLCDVTPDYSPILGVTPVEGFLMSAGWGTYGFKAAPITAVTMAQLIDTGKTPDLIAPFALSRFEEGKLVSEVAAAAVSH